MSSDPQVTDVKEAIRALLDRHGRVRGRDVREALHSRISRQAVHQHLSAMVATGELERVGVGKATWYQRAVLISRSYATAGLSESDVWNALRDEIAVLRDLPETAVSTMSYVFTEMVNNAVDHSGSSILLVRVRLDGPAIVVDVEDAGIGIFAKVARAMGSTPLEAAQRLTLGKFTTWPERHSGEGIFFSSRAADVFLAEANGVRWTVDNDRDDWALGEVDERAGTLIRFTIDPARPRSLTELFRRFTDPDEHRFNRTRAVVKMLDAGVRFVSRSEAKRLTAGLEAFDEVLLDFAGVDEVGQGFVDQVFRVWAAAHPGKVLEPVNMSEAVRFMIERGRPRP